MKKISVLILLLFLLFFNGSFSIAKTVKDESGVIEVSASQFKEITPNQAEISIVIQNSAKVLETAVDENNLIANKVYSGLKKLLGTDDTIKTGKYSAKPQYQYTRDNKRVFDKYVVTNTVEIKTNDTGLISKLTSTAISQGATGVQHLRFSAVDYNSDCNTLLADLTKQARSQADAVAKSINSKIVGIKHIQTTCNLEGQSRPLYGAMLKEDSNSFSIPIESGKVKIYARINASFFVE